MSTKFAFSLYQIYGQHFKNQNYQNTDVFKIIFRLFDTFDCLNANSVRVDGYRCKTNQSLWSFLICMITMGIRSLPQQMITKVNTNKRYESCVYETASHNNKIMGESSSVPVGSTNISSFSCLVYLFGAKGCSEVFLVNV